MKAIIISFYTVIYLLAGVAGVFGAWIGGRFVFAHLSARLFGGTTHSSAFLEHYGIFLGSLGLLILIQIGLARSRVFNFWLHLLCNDFKTGPEKTEPERNRTSTEPGEETT